MRWYRKPLPDHRGHSSDVPPVDPDVAPVIYAHYTETRIVNYMAPR